MKRIVYTVMLLVLGVTVSLYAASLTVSKNPKTLAMRHGGVRKLSITQTGTPPDEFTYTLPNIWGVIDRITIDSVGTDTSYKVYLYDEEAAVIYSKVDCSSAAVPFTALTIAGRAMPVAGQCQVEVADCNDATLTSVSVHIYYRENEK